MAGKTKFSSGNDFSFDSELDIPDFSSSFGKPEKRNARQVATGLSKSALKGAFGDQGLLDESFIRRTIKSTLPSGYGTALDIFDESTTTLRSLYNDTAKELKPVLNDMKRVVQRMEEPIDKYLPKDLAEKMKKFGRSIEAGASYDQDPEAQRDAMVMAQVGEVLKHQVVSNAKREQQEDSRSKIREGIDQVRHKDSMGQLNAIRLSVSQLAAYQNNIGMNFQRKSLELQFRSFYALRDLVVEQRRMNTVHTEAYDKIIKNTGLPDYVKMKEAERLKQFVRNKFADTVTNIGGGLVKSREEFIRSLGANLRKVAGQRVKDFAYGAQQGLQGIETSADIMNLASEMGEGPEHLIVGGVSGMAAQHYGNKLIQSIKKRLPKSGRAGELVQKGVRLGNQIQYHATNLPGKAKNWANSYDNLPGWARYLPDGIQDMLRDAILMDGGLDRTIQKDRLKDMQGPAVFTRQVAKSITEIIPGYLSRIFRELQVMRTGDEGIELTKYDFTTNKFSKSTDVKKKLYDTVVNKGNSKILNDDMEKLLDEIDPDKKLSGQARAALRKQLLNDNLHNRAGSAEHYMDPMNHHNGSNFELAKHFEDRYSKDNDRSYGGRASFAGKHVAIGQGIKLAREEIQDLANAGLLDQLEDLGLVDQFGNIDIDKIANEHLDGTFTPVNGKSSLRRASRTRGGSTGAGMRGAGIRHQTTNVHNAAPGYAASYDRSTAGSGNYTEIIAAIKENSGNPLLEKISDTLLRVEQEMKSGLVMFNAGDIQMARTGPDGKTIMDRSLRQNWQHGKDTVKGWGSKALDWWKKPGWGTAQWNNRHQTWGKTKGLFGQAKDQIGDWIGAASDKWQDMKEVWIDGEVKPRLTAWGFRAGMYYDGPVTDAKRKVIKSYKDIKGAVYDQMGEIILDPQQAASAFIRTTAGKKLLEAKNWIVDKAKKAFTAGHEGAVSAYGMARDALKKAGEYLDAQDVFTKDNLETPKLQATIMRAKGYRSMHRRDKYILTPGDIDGPVVNLSGDQVLTDNDLRTGICDRHGRPLLTGKLRLIQFGKDSINMALTKVQNGFNMAKDFLSGKWQGFKNWFHVDGIAFSGGKTIIERLTEIRDLLDNRLPGRKKKVLGDVDGDGVREGSYEDQVKKGTAGKASIGESAADAAKAAADSMKAGGMGIFGAMGAAGKSLLDAFKKRKGGKDGDKEEDSNSNLSTYGGLALDALSLIPGGKILSRGWRAARGVGKFGGRWGKVGLEGAGDLLKASGAARAAGKGGGLVSTIEALKASKGIKAAEKAAAEAEEIMQAAQAAGMPAHEAEALAHDALNGGKAAEKMGLGKTIRKGILNGLGRGFTGIGKGIGAYRDFAQAGNKVTWDLAKQGGRLAGRAGLEGAKLAGQGLWQAGKYGITKGVPALATDLSSNIGKVARFGGRGALSLAKAGGGLGLGLGLEYGAHYANTHGHKTIGSALGTAGNVVSGWGLASTAAGLMGIEGGTIGLLSAIALSPLAVGVIGAGIAGYGIYRGYKYLTRKKTTALSKLRLIQYGFAASDTQHDGAMWDLEDMLEPNVTFHPNGVPTLTNKGLKETDILKPFGIDPDDKEKSKNWLEWFTLRFKPVFLTHMAAMHKADEKAKGLKETEDFKPAQKKLYVSMASWPGGPYKYMTPPFPDMDGLATSDSDVADYAKTLLASIEVDVKKDPEANKSATKQEAPKTVAEIAAAATVAQGLGQKKPIQNWQAVKDMPGTDKGSQVGTSAAGAMITVKGTFDATHISAGSTLDGLSTIRFKTYGLKDMNLEKVKNLMVLENAVLKDITINDKFQAVYKGDIKKVFQEQAPAFGITGSASTGAYDWIAWFNLRFLPTYVAYLSGVCGATKKNDPRAAAVTLKPEDALAVAASVKTASGKNGSVWSVSQMPWSQYEANMDVGSTDENYAGLQERSTKSKLNEITGIPGAGDTESKKGGSGSSANAQPTSWLGKKWQDLTTGSDGKKNWLGKAADAVSNTFGGGGKSYQDAESTANGIPIQGTGAGTGGSMNSLPDPKGDGSWAALKDLIISASKMVGVDPTLMATMAAIESGFKATVKAGTSTATGLYQFVTGTWNDVVKKYGAKYGIGADTPRTNPKANALMGAEFTKANIEILRNGLGRQPSAGEVYAAHFLGAGTAVKLLKSDQSAIAATVLPQQAAANRNIFYEGSQPRTVGQVIGYLNSLVANKGKQFGIGTAGGEALTAADAGSTKGKQIPAAYGATPPGANAGADRFAANNAPSPAAGGPAPAGKPSTGTGAPMGFGGSSGPATTPAPAGGDSAPRTVFDSMGGNGKPAAGPTPTQAAASPNKPKDPFAVPEMGPGAAMGTGFSPAAARSATDLVATQRNQSISNPAAMAGGIAEQHLGVSKEILNQLQLLVKYAAQGAGQTQQVAAAPAANSTSSMQDTVALNKAAGQQAQPMRRAPISVAKPNFA